MIVKIDNREKGLLEAARNRECNHQIIEDVLPLGDAIICNNENEEVLLFERKTLNDLVSSIKDGRYNEQSYRLDGSNRIHNHNIIYIIEGNISSTAPCNKTIILSSICTLLYYKGFSVIRTSTLQETCDIILSFANKIQKEMGTRIPYYNASLPVAADAAADAATYVDVLKVKKVKSKNITPENIGEIMLCSIPSVSTKTANIIMNEYKTRKNLISSLETNERCLDHLCSQKGRHISGSCIENIKRFLLIKIEQS